MNEHCQLHFHPRSRPIPVKISLSVKDDCRLNIYAVIVKISNDTGDKQTSGNISVGYLTRLTHRERQHGVLGDSTQLFSAE